jgi:hypothetical protein
MGNFAQHDYMGMEGGPQAAKGVAGRAKTGACKKNVWV